MVTAVFDRACGGKAAAAAHLAKHDIDTRPIFSPLSSIAAYAGSQDALRAARTNAVAYAIGENGINLPSALNLSRSQVERVCAAVRAFAG